MSSPEVLNGKAAQVEILHREHTTAVSKSDFERAELINQQIKTLKTRMERESESSSLNLHSSDTSDTKADRESPADKQKRVVEKSQGLINRWNFRMNRALDLGDVDKAFLHAAKMIPPRRKLHLSPQSYHVLYHVVSTNLIGLSVAIADTTRLSNREIAEQYEMVRCNKGVLQRLYLIAAVGPELATRRVARRKDVIEELSEMLKQAQDPIHTLFLRHFHLSVFKQYLPESSHYEMDRSLKFLLQNFAQANRMCVRIVDTSQSAERHSLSVLVR
jgi:hypothetical protein